MVPVQTSPTSLPQKPTQQGTVVLQGAPMSAQTVAEPQVPLVAPGGTLHTVPAQQSASAVQAPPEATQGVAHTWPFGSQKWEQHWPSEVQAVPLGTQATQVAPTQSVLQHSPPAAQPWPVAVHPEVGWPHFHPPAPSSMQEPGAQQEVSPAPLQGALAARQLPPGAQCSTPLASGTQGEPSQHWSRNWQTLAGPVPGGMQQAGLPGS